MEPLTGFRLRFPFPARVPEELDFKILTTVVGPQTPIQVDSDLSIFTGDGMPERGRNGVGLVSKEQGMVLSNLSLEFQAKDLIELLRGRARTIKWDRILSRLGELFEPSLRQKLRDEIVKRVT